jgi:NADH dehydrogenase
VTEVDLDARRVELADGPGLPYDRLVLATGSTTNFFGMDEVERVAMGLKDLPEALELRNHILSCFEAAAREEDEVERRRFLTFVVVGGGPTGVEYAGALSELIRLVLVRDFPELDMRQVRVILVELAGRLLGAFRDPLGEYTVGELERRRIEVRLKTGLVSVAGDRVELTGGERILAKTVIWAAGVKPLGLRRPLAAARSPTGRLVVDEHLRVAGRDDVYAIGDLASVVQDGAELPMIIPPAMQQARHVARSILREIRGRLLEPFRYRDKGIMATIGRKAAVAQVGSLSIKGLAGWLAWLFLHIYYVIGFRNRLLVLLGWAWEYMNYDRPVRLIARARERELAEPPVAGDDP